MQCLNPNILDYVSMEGLSIDMLLFAMSGFSGSFRRVGGKKAKWLQNCKGFGCDVDVDSERVRDKEKYKARGNRSWGRGKGMGL